MHTVLTQTTPEALPSALCPTAPTSHVLEGTLPSDTVKYFLEENSVDQGTSLLGVSVSSFIRPSDLRSMALPASQKGMCSRFCRDSSTAPPTHSFPHSPPPHSSCVSASGCPGVRGPTTQDRGSCLILFPRVSDPSRPHEL